MRPVEDPVEKANEVISYVSEFYYLRKREFLRQNGFLFLGIGASWLYALMTLLGLFGASLEESVFALAVAFVASFAWFHSWCFEGWGTRKGDSVSTVDELIHHIGGRPTNAVREILRRDGKVHSINSDLEEKASYIESKLVNPKKIRIVLEPINRESTQLTIMIPLASTVALIISTSLLLWVSDSVLSREQAISKTLFVLGMPLLFLLTSCLVITKFRNRNIHPFGHEIRHRILDALSAWRDYLMLININYQVVCDREGCTREVEAYTNQIVRICNKCRLEDNAKIRDHFLRRLVLVISLIILARVLSWGIITSWVPFLVGVAITIFGIPGFWRHVGSWLEDRIVRLS